MIDENCIYWYIPVYVKYILVYTGIYIYIYHYSYLVTRFRGGVLEDRVMPLCWMHPSLLSNKSQRREILHHAQRMKRCSFSAWTGTFPLANPVFCCQSFPNCSRRMLICSTFSRETCQTRLAKRPSGILRRPTAFSTRSWR
jgi:hypothetical protein